MQYILVFLFLAIAMVQNTHAQSCKRITLGQVSWTDVRATTAIADILLERLGYRVNIQEGTVPEIYDAMNNNSVDAFLGSWLPADSELLRPYQQNNTVQLASVNLQGAKYTLAVPQYVYDAGVKNFSDIAKHRDKFDGYIYGLEKGNGGNVIIERMITDNAYGLSNFKILPTTERIMVLQVRKKFDKINGSSFLGWEPHPMNTQLDIAYLDGDSDYFGPNLGGSTVHTTMRAGFRDECPNAAKLLANLKFSLEIENQLMTSIDVDNQLPKEAAQNWINQHQELVDTWMTSVIPLEQIAVQ